MRQSDFKKKYDPELGRFTRQHIYGEGVMDVFKNIGSKIFGQTMKKAAKTAATKAITTAASKTGEHVGKKAGGKIIQMMTKKPGDEKGGEIIEQMLKKRNIPGKVRFDEITLKTNPTKRMTQQDINQRLNFILSDE